MNSGSIMNLFAPEDLYLLKEKMTDQIKAKNLDSLLLESHEAEFHAYF